MLRNIQMAFHLLDKDMMRNIITTIIRTKLEYAEVILSHTITYSVKSIQNSHRRP